MADAPPSDHARPPLWNRGLLLALVIGLSLLYIPINRSVSGGVALRLPLDDLIPLRPIWGLPYLLALVWWLAAWVWAALGMEWSRYRTFALAVAIAALTSYAVYCLYPTYVIRPEIVLQGWRADLMGLIYGGDRPYNALPSGHTYHTALIAIFWWDWKPRLRWLWAASLIAVILATLFTRQHYLLDPLAGLVWAGGSAALAAHLTRSQPRSA